MQVKTEQIDEKLKQQLTDAISASEDIVDCLRKGDFDAAKRHDLLRANFVRTMSKCRNLDELAYKYHSQLEKLSELNTSIMTLSSQLRDDVLTQMTSEHENKLRHKEYLKNQRL